MNDIDEIFAPTDGVLARTDPHYRYRPDQPLLARAIEEAIARRWHLLAEAPCGLGKSIAYLIAALYHASRGGRVVIATKTIELQRRLIEEDIPRLLRLLRLHVSCAMFMGRSNYLCGYRYDGERQEPLADQLVAAELEEVQVEVDRALARALDWAEETRIGDTGETNMPARIKRRLTISSDDCLGDDCEHKKHCRDDGTYGVTVEPECHYDQARARALQAQVVVTNHKMLALDMQLRRVTEGKANVLGAFDVLIVDEAHALADVSRDTLGWQVSLRGLVSLAKSVGAKHKGDEPSYRLQRAARLVFDHLSELKRERSFRESPTYPLFNGAELATLEPMLELSNALHAAHMLATKIEAVELAQRLKSAISKLAALAEPNQAVWLDDDKLIARPVSVAETLREHLFKRVHTVCMVSATLAVNGSFDFQKRELGYPDDTHTLLIRNQYDFANRAVLVVPDSMPLYRFDRTGGGNQEYVEACAAHVKKVVEACGGRTLILTTTTAAVNGIAARVPGLLRQAAADDQGDAPQPQVEETDEELLAGSLMQRFRSDETSSLIGTRTYWTGVDAPGETCICVVIDRLPNARPDEPMVVAMQRAGISYADYAVPKSVLEFRQGAGRLVRSETDYGLIVVLDRRLLESRTGTTYLASLPPMERLRSVEDAARIERILSMLKAPRPLLEQINERREQQQQETPRVT